MPISPYTRHWSDDENLERVKDEVESSFRTVMGKEILDGQLVTKQSLTSNVVKYVEHGLNREPRGWIPVRMRSAEISAAFIATSAVTGTAMKVNANALHSLYPGDQVTITGSTNYNATYRVLRIDETTFDILAVYGASETGTFTSYQTPKIADRQDSNTASRVSLALVSNVDVTADFWIF